MKVIGILFVTALSCAALGQNAKSTTVPITLDHNRIIIDVHIGLADGTDRRVRGWVDTGNPDLWMSERLANKVGLQLTGEPQPALAGQKRLAPAPKEITVGTLTLPLSGVKEAQVMLNRESIGPGTSAEINLPSTVLRNYDVVIDYPNRELTLSVLGSAKFEGGQTKAVINSENGLVLLPAAIQGHKGNAVVDVGATVSFLWSDLVKTLRAEHSGWPHMVGAVGPANLWGVDEEPSWEVIRVGGVRIGAAELNDVIAASFPEKYKESEEKRTGLETIGLLGADALLNYKVGIDYAHSTVYLEQTSKYKSPGIDVVGLILRPETDEHYTVIGVAEYEGKPSVPDVKAGDKLISVDGGRATGATMGQVWSLLEGSPGTVRTLVLERDGKQFTVKAPVREFLPRIKSASPAKRH